MDFQEFEQLSREERERYFAELDNQRAELLAENAMHLQQVRFHKAQIKSMQVDLSNTARQQCLAPGLPTETTDELLSLIRNSPGGLRDLQDIFEAAAPCCGDSIQHRDCFAAILLAVGRRDAWSELMDHE